MKVINNLFRPKVKAALLAGTLCLASSVVSANAAGSSNKYNNFSQNSDPQLTTTTSLLDTTKPNLPTIAKTYIGFKSLNGDEICIARGVYADALYKAVIATSTNEEPNITDVGRFYAEVEKNIPGGVSENDLLRIRNVTNRFKNLFDLFTHPDSKEGRTITVEEYTSMMEAWVGITVQSSVATYKW